MEWSITRAGEVIIHCGQRQYIPRVDTVPADKEMWNERKNEIKKVGESIGTGNHL